MFPVRSLVCGVSLVLLGLWSQVPAWAAQTVRVGVYQNSPKVSLSKTGQPEGIFIDVIENVAAREGWTLEYVPGTWAEGLERLAQGRIDLMPDVARNPEREALYGFHNEPVLASWNQVYTRNGSAVRSLLDLGGKRVAVLTGSVQEHQLAQMAASFNLALKWVPREDYDAAFAAVQNGEADAVVTNRFFGVRNAARYGLEDTAIIFSPSKLYFASPKGQHQDLLEAIDRQLLELKKDSDSAYYRSLRHWSVDGVRTATSPWLVPTLVASLALLLAGMAWVVLLRRQVAVATRAERQRNDEMLIINRTLRATGSRRELSAVLDEATKGALALTGFESGVLCLRDAGYPAMLDTLTRGKGHVLLPTGATGTPQACDNVADASVRWNAYFPLVVQERTMGILCLYSRSVQQPAPHLLELVEDICGPVALAMENARLYEQAQNNTQEQEQRVQRRTAKIAELSDFLQAIIDHTANPIFYKGADLRFRGCNRAYEKAFGVDRADILGKTVLDLAYLPQDDREKFQAEDAATVANAATVQREATMPFVDGKLHQTLYSVSGFRDAHGVPVGLVGVIVDITPIKEVQAALHAVNQEQSAIFEAANFGIALVQNRVVRLCNRRLEDILGYARGELSGHSTRTWYLSDAAYERSGDPVYAEVATDATHQREEQLLRKDGRVIWCRLTARALDTTDLAKGVVAVIEDVTAERDAAQALREAKEAAEAADRIKSSFLATMSHELRTPLNSIIGFTGIVLQELAGPLNTEQAKQLGMVRDSARHLLALINDVLDISKIEAGELKVGRAPFDLTASIQKVAAIVQPLADKKHLQLQVEISADLGTMHSDARRVEQVLLNLLSNAIKFTEKGTVRLHAQRVDDYRPAGDTGVVAAVRIGVQDTGMGIRAEDLSLLFTPFRQLDSELSRKHDGTGLGLAICQRLAELMGGQIEASSVWGQGSVFTATLPLEAPHSVEHA